jgi:hypothetical protein
MVIMGATGPELLNDHGHIHPVAPVLQTISGSRLVEPRAKLRHDFRNAAYTGH